MKHLLTFTGTFLIAALAGRAPAQVARPFADGRLLPEGQNRAVMLDAKGPLAAMVLPETGGEPLATAWEPDGTGTWTRTYEFGNFPYTCVAVDPPHVAVGYEGRITIYERINATKYILLAGPPLAPQEIPRRIVMQGGRIAAIVDKPASAAIDGSFARIYDNLGTSWTLTREIEILATGGILVDDTSVVSGIDLHGDRLAVAAAGENKIQVRERNQGGADQWGRVATLDGDAEEWDQLGFSVALDGDRLAASCRDGVQARVEVFGRNQGGANAWGRGGTLIAGALPGPGFHQLAVDRTSGRLAALGISGINFAGTPPASDWTVFGSAAGSWTREAGGTAGPVRMIGSPLPGLALTGDDLLHGLGDLAATASSWEVSVHRRGTGGATAWGLAQSLSGPDTPVGFGSVVAASGRWVAVGMPGESSHGSQSGAVMLWWQLPAADGSRWLPVGRLDSPVAAAGQRFGAALAMVPAGSGDSSGSGPVWLAVGAPGESGGRGAVHLHLLSLGGNLRPPLRIAPAALDLNDAFGTSVAFGTGAAILLAAGAPGDDDSAANAGAVYLFEDDLGGTLAWGQRAKRLMPAGETGIAFGSAVALTGNSLAATRPAAAGTGKVFLYLRNSGGADQWGHASTLAAPAGAPAGFPSALASSPDIPIFGIGATAAPGGNGRAYLYGFDTSAGSWLELFATTGSGGEGPTFGASVAVAFPRFVVGAPGTGGGGTAFTYGVVSSPATFGLFHLDTGTAGEAAGSSVAANSVHSFIGLPGADDRGPDSGAVKVTRSGSYEQWAASQGPAFTQWLPSQDPDGDGRVNLIEFGLGGDPLSAASRPVFSMNRTVFSNGVTSWPALEWSPPALPYPVTLLNYQMQRGTNLTSWSNTSPDGGFGLGDPPGRFYRMDSPREFFRLDLRYPEEPSSGGGPLLMD